MPRKVVAKSERVQDCPIFKVGDRMTFSLPELVLSECDAVCAIALADVLPWAIKVTAGGKPSDRALLCRGCRGGRAQAGFRLESLGEVALDPARTRKLVSLRVIPMFASLPDRELEKISEMIREVEFAQGEEIITYGEPGRALMIVTRGQVEVLKPDDDGEEKLLGILSHGECFGEMSLLTGNATSATIRAREPVRALQITKEDFDALLARNPVLNRYFSKLLALRLNNMSKAFSEERNKGVTGDLTMIGPAELIQAITITDRTGLLSIKEEGGAFIDIFFHDGQIWSIESSGEDDEEQFYEFLSWTKGKFSFEPRDAPSERTFTKDTTSLLLEGMKRLDDAAVAG
ncbi:MAG: DUF4388 domain-containing protein [Planctomycetota bacterium]|nr:MAG: DUF4388 domain-containing protein [Planctomycetota bacterium]